MIKNQDTLRCDKIIHYDIDKSYLKAIKNTIELNGAREANLRDGV